MPPRCKYSSALFPDAVCNYLRETAWAGRRIGLTFGRGQTNETARPVGSSPGVVHTYLATFYLEDTTLSQIVENVCRFAWRGREERFVFLEATNRRIPRDSGNRVLLPRETPAFRKTSRFLLVCKFLKISFRGSK